jgi:FtsH-binding integral membrane protein
MSAAGATCLLGLQYWLQYKPARAVWAGLYVFVCCALSVASSLYGNDRKKDENRLIPYLRHIERWLIGLCVVLGINTVLVAVFLGPSLFGFGLGALLMLLAMGLLVVRRVVG